MRGKNMREHDHDLYALLREKLADACVHQPIPPADWERMDDALDILQQENLALDGMVNLAASAELAAFTSDEMAQDWTALEAALPNSFDTILHGKLHQASLSAAADWEVMATLLPNEFDTLIQAKLDDASLSAAGDWDAFASTLDAEFDSLIKERLLTASAGTAGRNWRYFSGLWAEQRMAEMLRNASLPYNPADWKIMANMLAKEGMTVLPWYQQKRVYAVAAAVAALFVFGGKILTNLTTLPTNNALSRALAFYTAPTRSQTHAPNSSSTQPSLASAQKSTHPFSTHVNHASPIAHPVEESLHERELNLAQYESSRPLPDMLRFNAVAEQTSASLNHPKSDVLAAGREDILTSVEKRPNAFSKANLHPLTAFNEEVRLSSESTERPGAELIPIPDSHVKADVCVGVYAATIQSVTEFSGDESLQGNVSGLRMNVKLGNRWSFVTGLLSANKQFSHALVVYNPKTHQFENSQLNGKLRLVEIPILARYDLPIGSQFTVFIQGGVAANISLREVYQTQNLTDANGVAQTNTTQYKTYIGTLQFSPGVAYKLAQRVSIQAEPYLQVGAQHVGSTTQNIHSAGIAASVMYQLQ